MNETAVWKYLKSQGLTNAGVAGLMGNIYAESGLDPKNLQNSYEKSLGYTDETYTTAVDNGTYTNFVRDKAGYGLYQWTYWCPVSRRSMPSARPLERLSATSIPSLSSS